jgi:hypothetical protein
MSTSLACNRASASTAHILGCGTLVTRPNNRNSRKGGMALAPQANSSSIAEEPSTSDRRRARSRRTSGSPGGMSLSVCFRPAGFIAPLLNIQRRREPFREPLAVRLALERDRDSPRGTAIQVHLENGSASTRSQTDTEHGIESSICIGKAARLCSGEKRHTAHCPLEPECGADITTARTNREGRAAGRDLHRRRSGRTAIQNRTRNRLPSEARTPRCSVGNRLPATLP